MHRSGASIQVFPETPNMGMTLTASERRQLRGRCHDLSPVVTVAGNGLSDNVMAEIDQALTVHELIKIKLRGEREQRAEWIESIGRAHSAQLVQKIGQVACFYRPRPEPPVNDRKPCN
ncbi:MAG: YhbY family RNA-binding protein [Wenzhouxiangellaceae bacterium]|nr:YhbY family RNA-binding protein [Wenzhouxiangellaceae bacterium]